MKKILTTLLALVMVVSLVGLMAAPVAADRGGMEPQYVGDALAEWSTEQARSGVYSVKLHAPASTGDYGKVVMPLEMDFAALADFSFWVEGGASAQALPLHDVKLEIDDTATSIDLSGGNNHAGGASVDLAGATVLLASQPGQCEDLSDTLMTDGITGWEKYGTHSDADIDVGTGAYWSMFVWDAAGGYIGTYDYFTWDETHTALDLYATVTEVRAELRYPQDPDPVESTVYVDDITINGITYDLELPTLTVAVTPGGDIEVNGTDPVSYPRTYSFEEGTSVDLEAVAARGYEFDRWSGDLSGSTNPITITMDCDTSVTANFTKIPLPAVAPTPPEEPELSARLFIRNLTITPVYVEAGQPVTISADVVNDGGRWGSGTVNLVINGRFEQSKGVGVSPGTAQPISFTVYKTEAGQFDISLVINGGAANGSAQVIPADLTPAPQAGAIELGTGGIIAIVVIAVFLISGLAAAFLIRRRS